MVVIGGVIVHVGVEVVADLVLVVQCFFGQRWLCVVEQFAE